MNNSDLFNSNFRDLIEDFSQHAIALRDSYQQFQASKNSFFEGKLIDSCDIQPVSFEKHSENENKVPTTQTNQVINQEDEHQQIRDQLEKEYQIQSNELNQRNTDMNVQLNESQAANSKYQEMIKELENNLRQIQEESQFNKQNYENGKQDFINNIEQLTKINKEQVCQIDSKNLQIQLLQSTVQELQTIVDQKPQAIIKKELTQSLYQSPQIDPELMNKVYTPASVSSYRSDQVPKTPDERKKLFRDLSRNATLSASMMQLKGDFTTLQQIIKSNDNLSTKSENTDQ